MGNTLSILWRYLSIFCDVIRVRFFGHIIPTFVGVAVTRRCNLQCSYCDIYTMPLGHDLMSTDDLKKILHSLKNAGTKYIHFSGGEPLLRNDIVELVSEAKLLNMHVTINTNGTSSEIIRDLIPSVDLFIVSLDSVEQINDQYRGKGSYACAIKTIDYLATRKAKFLVSAVLHRSNIDHFKLFVKEMGKRGAKVVFQPARKSIFKSDNLEEQVRYNSDVEQMILSHNEFKSFIDDLSSDTDTLVNLKHDRYSLGVMKKIHSGEFRGKKISSIYFRINPDGTIPYGERNITWDYRSFDTVLQQINLKDNTEELCYNRMNIAELLSLKPRALLNLYRFTRK